MEKPKFQVLESADQILEACVGHDQSHVFEDTDEIDRKLDRINQKIERDEDFMVEMWIKFTK